MTVMTTKRDCRFAAPVGLSSPSCADSPPEMTAIAIGRSDNVCILQPRRRPPLRCTDRSGHALAGMRHGDYRAAMERASGDSVTRLLQRWNEGDAQAFDKLLPLVYVDLRRIAAAQLRRHDNHATLQTTALVHDVLLRLLDRPPASFESTAHLLNAAARMMRHHLINRARDATTGKRGGGWLRDDFTATLDLPIPDDTDLLDLDEALLELEQFDERLGKMVELRYFIGLDIAEIAATLGVTERTIRRDWVAAQAWLRDRLAS